MDIFYQSIFILQSIMLAYCAKIFYDAYFINLDKGTKKARFLCYFVIFLQSFTALTFDLPSQLNIFTYFFCIFLSSSSIKTTFKHKILSSLFFLTFTTFTEYFVVHTTLWLLNTEISEQSVNPYGIASIFMILFSRITLFFIIYCFKMYIHNKTLKFSSTIDAFNLLSPILAQIVLMILCFVLSPLLNQSEENLVIILMLLVFGFVIINLLSYIKNQELEEYRTKAIILDKEMEHYSREHQIIGEYLNELSILKHNIRHEILPILSKIPHTNDEILSEFTSIFDKVLLDDYKYFSKYSWLDIILNYQLHKAPNSKFSIKIDPNLNIATDPKIISVILGNLLDNAREADALEIELRISNQNSNLFISVENEFTGKIMLKNNLPVSSKKDTHLHGFGLSSVKQIVEKDDGIFKFSHKNNRFIVEILLLN